MNLRTLKRRHAKRGPSDPWRMLRGLRWTRREVKVLMTHRPAPLVFNTIAPLVG